MSYLVSLSHLPGKIFLLKKYNIISPQPLWKFWPGKPEDREDGEVQRCGGYTGNRKLKTENGIWRVQTGNKEVTTISRVRMIMTATVIQEMRLKVLPLT